MLGTFSCVCYLLRIIYAAADMCQCSVSVTAIKPHKQKQLGRKKGLTWFTPPVSVHSEHGGRAEALTVEECCLLACSSCFHNQLRVTCLVVTLPTVSWASSHQY